MLQHPMLGSFNRRAVVGLISILAVSTLTVGCNNNNDVVNTVAADVAATLTDTFTDTLTLNGAKTFPFVVSNPGDITAFVTDLTPDSSQIIGLSLGTWNGTSCQVVLSNDSAFKAQLVAGHATAAGNFCVRVYDSTGKLPQPETYIITVTHP